MSQSKRILFIEDDVAVADMYSHELKRHDYEVDIAVDGTTGLQKAMSGHYDILLVDLMIPKPDGMEVIKQLRGPDGTGLRNSHIIILTNLALDDKELAKMDNLIDKYLIKANTIPSKLIEEIDQLPATPAS